MREIALVQLLRVTTFFERLYKRPEPGEVGCWLVGWLEIGIWYVAVQMGAKKQQWWRQ